jgi:hypothetical protein
MTEEPNPTSTDTSPRDEKPQRVGFVKRFLSRLDGKLKEKAEASAQGSSCCGGGKGKDDKCC